MADTRASPSVDQENAALAQEIARLADENARLLQANLQWKRQMLMEENARLKGATGPPGLDVPPGLAGGTPPGLGASNTQATVEPPVRANAGYLEAAWDPVSAANAAMLAMAANAQVTHEHLKLTGAWPYTGMASLTTPSNSSSLQSSLVSSLASSCTGFGSSIMGFRGEAGDIDPTQPKTTLMLRNIPNSYSRDMLLELLDTHDFNAHYNLVYLPIDFSTRAGFGYAFVNFVDESSAELCMAKLQGFRDWPMPSEKVLDAMWSSAHQGFESHVERYRNSPVMHESVADELKPAIFVNGKRIAFPRPTKKIRAPRLRQHQAGGQ